MGTRNLMRASATWFSEWHEGSPATETPGRSPSLVLRGPVKESRRTSPYAPDISACAVFWDHLCVSESRWLLQKEHSPADAAERKENVLTLQNRPRNGPAPVATGRPRLASEPGGCGGAAAGGGEGSGLRSLSLETLADPSADGTFACGHESRHCWHGLSVAGDVSWVAGIYHGVTLALITDDFNSMWAHVGMPDATDEERRLVSSE